MKNAIWKSMLDSDMNSRYWKYLVNDYSKRDNGLKIFSAIMASGTVASWGLWEAIPYLWKVLSAVSAIVALSLPILNYQKTIEQMVSLANKWGELRIEYENLWIQIKNNEDLKSLDQIYKRYRKIESSLQTKETKLPNNQKLLKKCFEEVIKTRGLKKGE